MANYCANSIVFYSKNKAKLSVFLRKLDAAFASRGSHFYNLMVLHGYNNREIASEIDRRDSITACDSRLTEKEGIFSFRIDTETAWEPHMELFRKLLQERYGNLIQMVYTAEECGCGIYINSDVDGRFLPERYVIDCCHNGNYYKEYFKSFEDAVDWLKDEYGDFGFGKYDTISDIEDKINNGLFRGEEGFFNLHRFEPNYSYEERSVA